MDFSTLFALPDGLEVAETSVVREGWEQGHHNGLQLWRELQPQGYKGSSRAAYWFLAQLKQGAVYRLWQGVSA